MFSPVVMYRCESWTVKKAECWRTDAFKLWYWRRFLRVPWTTRRSKQSIWKGINPEYSSEGLKLKLKLHYFGHLMQRADSLEKTLMLGKMKAGEGSMTEDEMVGWHHQLNGHEFEKTLGNSAIWLASYDKSLLKIEYVVIEISYFQCYTQHRIFMDHKRNSTDIILFFLSIPQCFPPIIGSCLIFNSVS